MSTDWNYKGKQALHKSSKKLLKTDMWDVWIGGFVASLAISGVVGDFLLERDLDEITTPTTVETVANYQGQFNLLSLDYKHTQTSDDKMDVLNKVSNEIDNILMDEDLSERNVKDLFNGLENTMLSTDILASYDIGNIGDLRECRTELGAGALPANVAQCTIDESQDEKMVRSLSGDLLFSTLIFALMGGLTKRVGRKKLEEWAKKPPQQFKH